MLIKVLLNDSIEEYIGVDLEQSEYHNEVRPDLYWDGIRSRWMMSQ
jgi:hypothetical protein